MKIVIVGSMQFTEKMLEIGSNLESLGHVVFRPDHIYDNLIGKAEEEKERVKLEQKNNQGAMKEYWEAIRESDAILVLNLDKNGVKNYIGGNALMEIGFAYVLDKKIFLCNPIPDISYYKTEIEAVRPTIINGDLSLIK